MTETIANRLARALIKRGYVEQQGTSHYRVFSRMDDPVKFFVGSSGGLRYGHKVSTCKSLTGKREYRKLLDEATIKLENL